MASMGKAFVIGWFAIIAAMAIYEIYTALHNSVAPTLTDVTLKYLPWWVIMPFLTWLWLHFAIQYKYPNFLIKKILQG
jgi:hypothetical protein